MTDSEPTSQLEANKRLARRIPEEIFAEGDLDLLDELYAEDAVERNAMGTHRGRPAIRESYNSFLTAFPDVSQTVENIVAEGDLVAVRITSRGTHKGELGGLEPTGKEIEVQQMFFARIKDGRITERWFLPDNLSLLQQLGVIDFPPS
ncbi:ester cyclase [Haladaptatus pallidirubidus]|uniref:Ester cyclase n=1 Tax=Haladaptatus pallidirubidus TaxID=1008152 RepID=A0AAV3UR92_9EURY|nr:ester cyclase [Haladaptatus pallidirubidus]